MTERLAQLAGSYAADRLRTLGPAFRAAEAPLVALGPRIGRLRAAGALVGTGDRDLVEWRRLMAERHSLLAGVGNARRALTLAGAWDNAPVPPVLLGAAVVGLTGMTAANWLARFAALDARVTAAERTVRRAS